MEHLITAEPHFLVIRGPHARPLHRYLLAHDYAVATLRPPPIRGPVCLLLAALTNQIPNLVLHQQFHQLQARLPNQFAHAFSEPAHHLGHGQHHLHRRVSFRDHCLELLYSSLRFNLVWFLHSDSLLFLAENYLKAITPSGVESRYFLRSSGHSPHSQGGHLLRPRLGHTGSGGPG